MARVNPPLSSEHVQYNPIHRVTGLFDGHDAVTTAVRDLEDAGVARDDVDILSGAEGERALDPSGDAGGMLGRAFRSVENMVSDTAKFHEIAAATLNAGGFIVAVRCEGDEEHRHRVMGILTRQGARDVKYWHNLYVEQGHEDEPRQNLVREDR
ncbi:hypothetical protein [Luteitalea sp. TBR-22]|uniref:hypothetical protein n=1 Tax=Luteitalea sp. TBR-22 TaxID=2802971 RepID=UPI001EF67774|nr:hypothetical protein [Luteitalea sp. TBR-22]